MILLYVPATVVAMGYGGPYVVHFIDVQYPYHPLYFISTLSSAWATDNLGGYQGISIFEVPSFFPYAVLSIVGVPPWIIQGGCNIVALWLAGIGTYLLAGRLSKSSRAVSGGTPLIFAAVYYMLSLVAVEILFWDLIPIGPFLEAALPFSLYFVVRSFDSLESSGQFDWTSVFGAVGVSVYSIGANEPFAVSSVLMLFGFLLVFTLRRSRSKFSLRAANAAIVSGGVFMVNLFWMLPEYYYTRYLYSAINSGQIYSSNLYNFNYTHGLSVLSALQLRGIQTNLAWYTSVYSSNSGIAFLMVPLTVLVFLPLILLRRFPRRERSVILLLTVLLLTGTVAYAGMGSPLYSTLLNKFFLQPLVLQVLHNTANAVGLEISLSEALLFVFAVDGLLSKAIGHGVGFPRQGQDRGRSKDSQPTQPSQIRGKAHSYARDTVQTALVAVALILIVGPAIFPALSGSLIPPTPYQSKSMVPSYEFETGDYVNSNAGSAYTLLAPGGFQELNWSDYGGHGYDGFDVLTSIIKTPVIYTASGFGGPVNRLIRLAYSDLYLPPHPIHYSELLSSLRIKYVIIEGGVGDRYPYGITTLNNASRMIAFLSSQHNISEVARFGLNTIFANLEYIPREVIAPTTYLGENDTFVNITLPYWNSTQIITNLSTVRPSIGCVFAAFRGITCAYNGSVHNNTLPFPGYPIAFNTYPLAIPIGTYPDLQISFSTGAYTAVSFGFTSARNLSQSAFGQEWYGTTDYSNPQSNAIPNAGWYYSPNATMTVQISLANAYAKENPLVPFAQPGMLNFLYVALAPTFGNSQEILNTSGVGTLRPMTITLSSLKVGGPTQIAGSEVSRYDEPVVTRNITKAFSSGIFAAPHIESNLTKVFFDDSQPPRNQSVFGSTVNVTLDSKGGFWLNSSASSRSGGLPPPGLPVAFNTVPLSVNITTYPFISFTIEANENTAVSFGISCVQNLTTQNYSSAWVDSWSYSSPYSNARPGVGWYWTGASQMTIVVDLAQAFNGSSHNGAGGEPLLNFVSIALAQTSGNELLVNQTAPPSAENLSVAVRSIKLIGLLQSSLINASEQVTSSVSPLSNSNGTNGFSVSVSTLDLQSSFPFPGYPIAFNTYPLAIPIGTYPDLQISFSTGAYTAVSFGFTSARNLSQSAFGQEWYGTTDYSNPQSNAIPNAGWYYSPNATMTVQISLANAYAKENPLVPFAQPGMLNFLYVALAPTFGNITEKLSGTPTDNLSIEVFSIVASNGYMNLGSSSYVPANGTNWGSIAEVRMSVDRAMNASTDYVAPTSVIPLGSLANTTISRVIVNSPDSIRIIGTSDGTRVLLVYLQNWNPGWSLEFYGGDFVLIRHIMIDGFANGWLIQSGSTVGNFSATISFSGSTPIMVGLGASIATLSIIGMTAILATVRRSVRRKSARFSMP